MTKVSINIGGKIVEVDKEVVSGAVETGELNINTDGLMVVSKDDHVVYSKSDFETYNNNFGKQKYEEGKTVGEEMLVKAARAEDGLEFEGKSFTKYRDALKAKLAADANTEPNTKITELTSDLSKLQTNYADIKTELEDYKNSVAQEKTRAKKDAELLGYLPQAGLLVNKDITLVALKAQAGVDIDYNEAGKAVVTVKGEVQKDSKTMEPVEPSVFIGDKLKALGLLEKPEGGSGGGDAIGAGEATGYDRFVKEMATLNIVEGSKEFSTEMGKRISNKTLTI